MLEVLPIVCNLQKLLVFLWIQVPTRNIDSCKQCRIDHTDIYVAFSNRFKDI